VFFIAALITATLFSVSVFGQSDTTLTPVEQIRKDAAAMQPLVKSAAAKQLLEAYTTLPTLAEPRIVYFNRAKRDAMSEAEYVAQGLDTTSGYLRRELGEQFYYFTMYGSPVAFVRALDLVGQAGLKSLEAAKICEFGFGSIGQLKAMAALGADVHGIEVEPLLRVLYGDPTDTGRVTGKSAASGRVNLHFGFFPTDTAINRALGGGYDLFVSKNTLKRGYVHPEKDVDPKMLVHLGVDDSTFVKRVYDLLKPGGYFLIYNLHPKYTPPTAEKYIPWSDGRSPFAEALYEKIGFQVLAFDQNDTEFAHQMAKAFGWDESMDLANDLFGMYTLVRRE
jgi:hypothetical protein